MKKTCALFLLLLVFLITTTSAAAKYTEKITFTVTVKKNNQSAPTALPEPDEALLHEDHSIEDSEEEYTDMDKEIPNEHTGLSDAPEQATTDDALE